MIGKTISHYKIIEKLGGGGMGIVYKAQDLKLNRFVALKFLPPHLTASDEENQRFIHEAKAASTLEHNNICNIHEIDETEDGQLFISMAYYEGKTLDKLIREKPLPIEEAIDIAIQIAQGLNKAHEKEIVHRDIKPANIMVTADGVVKILDFGLAKLATQTKLTKEGTTLGTIAYMSPEQARGEEVDQRSDIWSIGVILYEMLTGQLPFRGEYDQAVIYSILNERPDPSALSEQTPEPLRQVIFKCMEKDRTNRYQEAEELLSDLINTKQGSTTIYVPQQYPLPSFLSENEIETEEEEPIFVARAQEIEKLGRFLKTAIAGKGRVVFVTGEAGIGKTTLIREFTRSAQEVYTKIVVANGKCNAHTGIGDPYLPFIEILNLLTGDVEAKYKAAVISRDHALRLWNLLPSSVIAILEKGPDLINIFTSGSSLVSRASAFCSGQTDWLMQLKKLVQRKSTLPVDLTIQQSNLFEQYTQLLQSLSREQPLLLVLDDLQWVDQGSASLLFHIGRQIRDNRILVVGSFRTSEVTLGRDEKRHPIEPIFHELKRDFGDIELDLEKARGREFVDAFLDTEPNEFDEKFREILFTQTKGQPLFTVELWRTMKEQGMLIQNQEGRWIKGQTFDWNSLPSRVDAVIRERIGRLTIYMQEILTYASIEGEEFTAELVALLQKQEVRELIRILSSELEKRHHLVAAKGIRSLENQRLSLYVFQNILFQKYLYNTLDEVQRTYLHEEVGNLLESLYGDRVDEISVQLARHFQKAGILPKALKYLADSGTRALHLSAYAETIVHFKKALDILRTISPTPEREQQELSFQIALASSLQATQGFASPEVISTCGRIQEICQRIAGSPQVFHALYFLANFHWLRAEHIAGFELTKQMINLARKSDDPLMLALTHYVKGILSFNMGKLCSAKEHLEKMNAFYNPAEHSHLAFIYGQDPGQISGSNTSCVLWCLGYPDQALQQSQKALAIARKVDHPFSLTGALAMDTLFNLLRRDIKALEERGKEVAELAEKKGFLFFVGVGVFKIGVALAHKGQIEEGMARLHQALNIYRITGVRFTLTDLLASIAEVYGMAGQIAKAFKYISQALAEVERGGERYYEAEIHRIKGELMLRKAERKDRAVLEKNAEICFRKSIDIAQNQKARCLELRTALRLSRLWQKQGYSKKARKLLTEIYTWFTEGFETPELREAKALLEELGL